MTEELPPARRISVDERAARRRELNRNHPDRFAALTDVLVNTRTSSLGPATDIPAVWHPIATKLVVGTLIVLALAAILYVGSAWLREGRIDTWAGPTGSVTSGQRVLDCLPATTVTDSYLPTWIRFGGSVYGKTPRVRAVLGPAVGATGQVETGYRLDRMRLLLPTEVAPGEVAPRVYVLTEPGPVATIYERAPACS